MSKTLAMVQKLQLVSDPAIGNLVDASPANLVKVRMQADGLLVRQGLQPRRHCRAVERCISKYPMGIFGEQGELACYDHAKRLVIQTQICDDNIYAHTLSSIISALSATTLSCPADAVKTRRINQAVRTVRLFTEVLLIVWPRLSDKKD
ncbi:hypothetical protein RJ641_012508 [Dillenia turbinata]|uniref:Uncharacterized protein n=1 Tax=Dillenia turbinata TaxID=194707 RepID=A0AAN8V286_9MAGN